MADYQNLSAPELNQINGSSSALGEGTFKRRDELRRAESVQRNRVRMSERLDRNITRAVRKGDANSARAFNALKESITGQGYMGGGGIVNAEDQQDRVKDGAVKAADTRHNMGNIGNTNPADGPIANAPPPVEKPQGGGPEWDFDNSGIPDSIQRPIAGPQTAPEAAQATSASPSVTPQPQGSIADVSAKRAAVSKLRNKWASQKAQDEAPEKAKEQARLDYEAKNGAPNTSSMEADRYVDNAILNLDRSKFSPEQIKAIRKNMEGLSGKDREEAVATGKKKGEAWGAKADEVIGRAKSTVSGIKSEIESRKGQVKSIQDEIAESRKSNQELINGNNRPLATEIKNNPADVLTPSPQSSEAAIQPSAKPSDTTNSSVKVNDNLGWLKPGVSPYQAKQSLTEVHGYSSAQADALIQGRGITVDGMKINTDKDKLNRSQIQASINRSAANEFSESVRKNPPTLPDWMAPDSIAAKAYLALRGHDKAKVKEYERQQREEARQKLGAAVASLSEPAIFPK